MNTDQFWQIIDEIHAESTGDMDRKCKLLKQRLSHLGEQELKEFIDHFDSADAAAYTWPLWGAAYVMHGGCSDDSFDDFRATLISQGRAVYERALKDPESLADLTFDDEEAICYEGFQFVAHDVAKEKLSEFPKRTIAPPKDPTGEEWDEGSVDLLYPKLAAKYSIGSNLHDSRKAKKSWWKFWECSNWQKGNKL
jgi:hypothetical protein